jgi:hypothetical protein
MKFAEILRASNFTLQRTSGSRCSPRPLSVALDGREASPIPTELVTEERSL